jgi:hypothetical protein
LRTGTESEIGQTIPSGSLWLAKEDERERQREGERREGEGRRERGRRERGRRERGRKERAPLPPPSPF